MVAAPCDTCADLHAQLVVAREPLGKVLAGHSLTEADLDALRRLEALAQLHHADGVRP